MNQYRSELRGDVIYYVSDGDGAHEWRKVPSGASAYAEYVCTRCECTLARGTSGSTLRAPNGYVTGWGIDQVSASCPCGGRIEPPKFAPRPLTTAEAIRSVLGYHLSGEHGGPSTRTVVAAVMLAAWLVASVAAVTLLR